MRDRETEVNEVFENFTNIEKECEVAKQLMSAELQEKIAKLREDWTYVKARGNLNAEGEAAEVVELTAKAPEDKTSQESPVKATEDVAKLSSEPGISNIMFHPNILSFSIPFLYIIFHYRLI